MAELIQKQDTLNEGRVKINAAITDAEQAKITSDGADDKATQALAKSESTQTQLDTIVIDGDSSVEAAQARVDEKGVGHTTLKDRIDDGFTKVTSQLNETELELSEKVGKNETGVLDLNIFDEPTRNILQGQEQGTINAVLGKGNVQPINIAKKAVLPEKILGGYYTNMFDKHTAVIGSYIDNSGNSVSSNILSHSSYIPVEEGDELIVTRSFSSPGYMYDEKKQKVSKLPNPSSPTDNYSFIIPSGVHYIIINIYTTSIDRWMLIKGSIYPETYERYGWGVNGLNIKKNNLDDVFLNTIYKWHGKTIVTFGDSITWYDGKEYNNNTNEPGTTVKGYQSYIRDELGATVINQGVSGNTMQQICARIEQYNFTEIDACIIMGGTNNYRDQEESDLGEIAEISGSFDRSKFTGALQTSIEYILNNNPECKVLLLTPIKGWYTTRESMSTKIPDKIKEVAQLYGIPVCDLYRNSGINELTENPFIVDSDSVSFRFHPSTQGYRRMSDVIIPFLINR